MVESRVFISRGPIALALAGRWMGSGSGVN